MHNRAGFSAKTFFMPKLGKWDQNGPKAKFKIVSLRPSVLLSRHFLVIVSLVFSEIWHGVEIHMKLSVTEPDFLENFLLPQNWEKVPKMGQKQCFFNLFKNLVINFY